mmetsp:Transcript_20/g.13  ORF Transcript_20/g.13 Transcript_20/m.13 type:complete len:224 (-) Transcript_20:317-988(-)
MQFEATRRFLIAQGVFNPILYTLIATTIFHVIGLTVTVIYLGWEIYGVGIVTACTFTLNFIIINGYVNTNNEIKLSEKWFFMDKEAFDKIPIFLKYGISAALMLVFEILGYDILMIYSGWIGPKEQAATIIMFQIWIMVFMNTLAVTFSSTSLIGNSLGENKPIIAKSYAKAALIFGISQLFAIVAGYHFFRFQIIGAFTSDYEVTGLIMDSFIFYTAAMLLD